MAEISKYKRSEKENLIKIGRNIREIRKKVKVTQADLAKSLQCSQDRISRIENGTSRMSLNELVLFCRCLHTDPNEVLGWPPQQGMNSETWDMYREYIRIPKEARKAIAGLVETLKKK